MINLINPHIISILTGTLLILISCLSVCILFSRNLLNCVLYCSLISILSCLIYLILAAPDVALTEASIGVVLGTIIPLLVVKKLDIKIKSKKFPALISGICATLFILLIISNSLFLPEFGSEQTPSSQHMAKYYIENTSKEVGIPNMVAAILASYRGFDTLGETLVIMIAGLCVYLILSKENKENE